PRHYTCNSALSEHDVSAEWDTVGGLQPEPHGRWRHNTLQLVADLRGTAGRVVPIFRRTDFGHADHNGDKQFHSASDGLEYSCADRHPSAEYHDCSCQWRLSLHDLAEYGGAVGGRCGAGFASRTGGDVPSGQQRVYHGDSLLQEYGEHRDACRELVEQRGNVAGECDVHGGERLGVATGEFFQSGGDHGEYLLRGLYHTTIGHYSVTGSYFATTGVDNAPLHAPV